MQVSYSPKLMEYMAEQENKDILISTFKPKGCATLPEHQASIITAEQAADLVEKGTFCLNGELGRVFIARSWVPENEDAEIGLDLSTFFGTKTIRATGLKKFKVI